MRDYGAIDIAPRLFATGKFTEREAMRLAIKIESAIENEENPDYEETEKDMELIRQYDAYLEYLVNEKGYSEVEAYH